jgi:hypothetical protein
LPIDYRPNRTDLDSYRCSASPSSLLGSSQWEIRAQADQFRLAGLLPRVIRQTWASDSFRFVVGFADFSASLQPKPRHRHPTIAVSRVGVHFRQLSALGGVRFVAVHGLRISQLPITDREMQH